MTLQDIEKMDKPMLLATDIAPYLGVLPHSIRCQAHADPVKLGFPVIVCGSRVLVPKDGFLQFCRGDKKED